MLWARAILVAGVMGAMAAPALDAQARRQPPAAVAASGFSGTWEMATPAGGTVTLVLTQQGQRVTGTLSGNGLQFEVEAQLGDDGGFYGTARGRDGTLFIGGEVDGAQLGLALAEMTAAGVPDMRTAQELRMSRAGAAGAAGAATAAPSAGASAAGSGSAGGGNAAAAAGGSTSLAATPQDQQIAQLLVSSPWCWMQYSQISGATTTERVVFGRDGRVSQGTGREAASNNQYGSYYGRSSGGQQGYWRVENGNLMLSEDGRQYGGTPLQITRNSNGYPIITANGREYNQCN